MSLCTICTKERNQTIAYIIPTESSESMKSMCYYIYMYMYIYIKKNYNGSDFLVF